MPSKGQKVAKRQNQLRNRRRRGPGRASTQTFEAGPEVSTTAMDDEDGVGTEVATAATATVAEPNPAASRRRRARQAAEDQGSPAYRYLGGELRHIGIVTLVILVILAAATFTLGEVI